VLYNTTVYTESTSIAKSNENYLLPNTNPVNVRTDLAEPGHSLSLLIDGDNMTHPI